MVVCRQAAATSPAGATGLRNPPQLPSSVLNPVSADPFNWTLIIKAFTAQLTLTHV